MEESNQGNQEDDEEEFFRDASDEFPFYDCLEAFFESIDSVAEVSSSSSTITLNPEPYSGSNHRASLRRRRRPSAGVSLDSDDLDSSVSFGKKYVNDNSERYEHEHLSAIKGSKEGSGEFSLYSDSKEEEDKFDFSSKNREVVENTLDKDNVGKPKIVLVESDDELGADQQRINGFVDNDTSIKENSAITGADHRGNDDYVDAFSSSIETRDGNTSFIVLLAGLVLKAMGFQFNLLFNLFMCPFWLIYSAYMIVVDPFYVLRWARKVLIHNIMGIRSWVGLNVSGFLSGLLKEHTSFLRLGLKLGWGLMWSFYVCVVLVCLLVGAFVSGRILVNVVVEEPIRIKENLNFDYTEVSPVAFVPVPWCPGAECCSGCTGNTVDSKLGGLHGLPLDHKFQVTVSLTLPESDYNRNLGIFQVRVDFLAADGKVLTSSRRPCMLRFSSQPIRLLSTFFKMAPLLSGYSSESQDLNIKFRSFAQVGIPVTCLRVMIEQRAQFQPGGGIPEIYTSSLALESEQPLLKRILWYWKKTIFVWISMTIFAVELLIALICCKPIILPRVKLWENSSSNHPHQDNGPIQR